jgi:sulfur dioxygenase
MPLLKPNHESGIPEVTCQDIEKLTDKLILIDVREDDEFTGELGHIKGSKLITLGEDFEKFIATANKDQEMVLVCRSGNRSGRATAYCMSLGFKNTYNLEGGMLEWNALKLPVSK